MSLLELREPASALTHALGAVLAVPVTLLLWRSGRRGLVQRLSLLIFGLSLAACYSASALYHGAATSRDRIATFARLDLVGIYLLIAGTYTPVAWALLRGRWRWGLLGFVWAIAGVASVLLAAGVTFPQPVSTGLYLGMGWAFVVGLSEINRAVSPRLLRPLILGGVFYSAGAIINTVGWPAPWPRIFAAHEVFHLFVLAGSACHVWFMFAVIVPFVGPRERSWRMEPAHLGPIVSRRLTRPRPGPC